MRSAVLRVQYGGRLYLYQAEGFHEPLPDPYTYAGEISKADNLNPPEQDFHGSRVEVGQKLYADPEDLDSIYVEYSDGYARFAVGE